MSEQRSLASSEADTGAHKPFELQHGIPDQTFRRAMSHFGSGVTVVTTVDADGVESGFTASSFTSLSRTPPLILVCLARSASSYLRFVEASRFGVSILHGGQADIARLSLREVPTSLVVIISNERLMVCHSSGMHWLLSNANLRTSAPAGTM